MGRVAGIDLLDGAVDAAQDYGQVVIEIVRRGGCHEVCAYQSRCCVHGWRLAGPKEAQIAPQAMAGSDLSQTTKGDGLCYYFDQGGTMPFMRA